MNDTLKAAGRIGAELGAAKAENERLRGLLREVRVLLANSSYRISGTAAFLHSIDAALSQHTEPTDTYTAVDMATAAAQGFRDGLAAVEQAAAQDERKTFEVEIPDISAIYDGRSFIPYRPLEAGERLMTVAQHLRIEKQLRAALTRPAQTEQQPAYVECRECTECGHAGINDQVDGDSACSHCLWHGPSPDEDKCPECQREWTMSPSCPQCGCRYRLIADADIAAPIAQTATQPEQSGLVEMVDRAMVEMRNIHPPMRRSDCERLIRAALSAQGAGDADS